MVSFPGYATNPELTPQICASVLPLTHSLGRPAALHLQPAGHNEQAKSPFPRARLTVGNTWRGEELWLFRTLSTVYFASTAKMKARPKYTPSTTSSGCIKNAGAPAHAWRDHLSTCSSGGQTSQHVPACWSTHDLQPDGHRVQRPGLRVLPMSPRQSPSPSQRTATPPLRAQIQLPRPGKHSPSQKP